MHSCCHIILVITHNYHNPCYLFVQSGKYGLPEVLESDQIHVAGLVIGDYCEEWNHWEGTSSLGQWMKDQGIPGIHGTL